MSTWRRISVRLGPATAAELHHIVEHLKDRSHEDITEATAVRAAIAAMFTLISQDEKNQLND